MKALLKIGDLITLLCSALGITPERIEAIIKRPCGCRERARMLNELQEICLSAIMGRITGIRERLEAWLTVWEERVKNWKTHETRDGRKDL